MADQLRILEGATFCICDELGDLHGRFDEALTAFRIGDVELYRRYGSGDPVGAACPADHACAFSRKRLSGSRADAAGRAGDDRRLSLQSGHRRTLLTTPDRAAAGEFGCGDKVWHGSLVG